VASVAKSVFGFYTWFFNSACVFDVVIKSTQNLLELRGCSCGFEVQHSANLRDSGALFHPCNNPA
jgi:hypothetical protein